MCGVEGDQSTGNIEISVERGNRTHRKSGSLISWAVLEFDRKLVNRLAVLLSGRVALVA